jgi:hypothetical protein
MKYLKILLLFDLLHTVRKMDDDAQEVDYESDVTTWQDDCDVVIDEKSDTDEANLSRSFQLYKLF